MIETAKSLRPRLMASFVSLMVLGASSSACKTSSPQSKLATIEANPPFISQKSDIHITFLGTSTLLFDDGETRWITDGFFTRPNLSKFGQSRLRSDDKLIDRILDRLKIKTLSAVVSLHSHYDHALDAPLLAKKTEALLIGSNSTALLGRAFALPQSQIQVVKDGDELNFGKWKVTLILSAHSPNPKVAGEIDKPPVLPLTENDYKPGESFSLLVEHSGRSLLLQASAGFVPGKLQGRKADAAYIAIDTLDKQDETYRNDYWRETVEIVGAKRAFVVHWDDTNKSLEDPLVPAVAPPEEFDKLMKWLKNKAKATNVDIQLPQAFKVTLPFPEAK